MQNAHLQEDTLVIAPVLAFMGDNPRASEVVGHMTGYPNKFCRQCMVSFIELRLPFVWLYMYVH